VKKKWTLDDNLMIDVGAFLATGPRGTIHEKAVNDVIKRPPLSDYQLFGMLSMVLAELREGHEDPYMEDVVEDVAATLLLRVMCRVYALKAPVSMDALAAAFEVTPQVLAQDARDLGLIPKEVLALAAKKCGRAKK
jgi:hypothetical protein